VPVGFEPHVDRWVDKEQPDQALRSQVLAWIQSRLDDPLYASRPVDGFPLGWRFAKVPDTVRQGTVVVCTYFVDVEARTVTCKGLEVLSLPV
jgi:hypothetical protein